MPIHSGKDKQGNFYRWGTTGKKFYFDPESEISKGRALSGAKKQEAAIYAFGYRGDVAKMKLIKICSKRGLISACSSIFLGIFKNAFPSLPIQ